MEKELKEVVINGEAYNYIDYGDGSTSVEGMRIDAEEAIRKLTKLAYDVGGLARDMLRPITEMEVREVVLLSYTSAGMNKETEIHFIGDVDRLLTKTPSSGYAEYMLKKIRDGEIPATRINTLEYIKEHYDKYKSVLISYYSPKHTEDSGIYVKNDGEFREVKYGETLEVKNVAKYLEDIDDPLLNADKVYIKIRPTGINPFGVVGSTEYEKDGKVMYWTEGYLRTNSDYAELTEEQMQDTVRKTEIDELHAVAIRVNKEYKRYGKLAEELVQHYLDELYAPYSELISYGQLVYMDSKGYFG